VYSPVSLAIYPSPLNGVVFFLVIYDQGEVCIGKYYRKSLLVGKFFHFISGATIDIQIMLAE